MKRRITLRLLFIFLVSSFSIQAQDLIRTATDTIKSKVIEVGLDEIRYKDFKNLDGPIYVIEKRDVIEIIYENGTHFLIKPDVYDVTADSKTRNKTRCIKFEFFSPLTNDLAFGYETMLKVGTNLEFKAAVIGPGTQRNTYNASGFFLKGGVKFLTRPSYSLRGMKHSHPLAGGYIKPEFIFNTYTKDKIDYGYNPYYPYYTVTKIRYTNFCVNIVFGKQYILGDAVTLDYYFGLGYGLETSTDKSSNTIYGYDNGDDGVYSYSHLYFGKYFPLIMTGGLTIGVIF